MIATTINRSTNFSGIDQLIANLLKNLESQSSKAKDDNSNGSNGGALVVAPNPISSTGYYTDNLPLFASTGPSINDVNQNGIGDCYFLAGLAGLAQDDPSFIESSIKSDGNGIYSVRFFDNGKADWVTINDQVASNGAGSDNTSVKDSWAAIEEKAYVVFSNEYLGTADNYTAINGGFSNGLQAVTGDAVTDYFASSSTLATWDKDAISVEADLKEGEVVMYASYQSTVGGNGKTNLVADHMLTVTGFDSATGDFILRNPWGTTYGDPSWNITFEASAQQLFGNGGSTAGDFIVNDSVGAGSAAGQLTQALAASAIPTSSAATILTSSKNLAGTPTLVAIH